MPSTELRVSPCREGLKGSVPLPADPDILERALLFAALASGTSNLVVERPPAHFESALAALAGLGVRIERAEPGTWRVSGRGLHGFEPASGRIELAGAPVLAHGLLACLAAQAFASELGPFEPGEHFAHDLRCLQLRGAELGSQAGYARLEALSVAHLGAQEVRLTGPSPLSKHVCLMAGLYADGASVVHETLVSADHTERMLDALGCAIETVGPALRLEPPRSEDAIGAFEFRAPGSVSAAGYLLGAAASIEGSHVTVRGACLNPTRLGSIEALRRFGAELGFSPNFDTLGEPVGELTLKARPLSGGSFGGELVERASHEVHALAALAARARGPSEFRDLGALLTRGDLAKIVGFLRSFGVEAELAEDGFWVQGLGAQRLRPSRVTSGGDPLLAALGILLALGADGDSVIDDVDCLTQFLPRFVGTLKALGARLEVVR